MPTSSDPGLNKEIGKIRKQVSDDGGIYSDATLFVLSSKNNSNIEVDLEIFIYHYQDLTIINKKLIYNI